MQKNNNNFALIMAGGVGTRLWPVSRKDFPKQFHDVLGVGESLLQLSYNRLLDVCPEENIYIISNQDYYQLIKEQLPAMTDDQILLEPQLRNTAPCVAYAVHKIAQKNPDANLIVSPADHLILKQDQFKQVALKACEEAAKHNVLITFGITPTRPDTGYGYIEYDRSNHENGVYKVAAFKEKPDLPTAEGFLKAGNFVWNSGIFVWSIDAIKKSFEKYLPEMNALFDKGSKIYYSQEEERFIQQAYDTCINISIDYGILEKAENVYVIPVDFGWTDLGTWKSIDSQHEKDKYGNSLQGTVLAYDTKESFIKVPKGEIAVVQGLENYIVIYDGKALMICQKDQEQMVKKFLGDIKEKGYNEFV
ncbi:mannose-1-phosphate guanylyltransferase [Catalinimonas niigatensis]|uniref:mannose-1-phosphate guanylyltransferase n=1 Tax=Catalinimonas niigatensis TaxID=1397264 RepID=UPI002665EA10|nr:mannose-1-phosphate guanylyltransferase [Catalinimonas niigatensis]WPP48257.1 mannose-1-phosphate guanylyltransferase [Catalinimonas niigatensis]